MQPVFSSGAIKVLDRESERLGVAQLLLMESAARGGAEYLQRTLGRPLRRYVFAVCGKGGNGGDALGIARWLGLWGTEVLAIILGDPVGAAAAQANAFAASFPGRLFRVRSSRDLEKFRDALVRADLVIDGLLGVGIKGAAKGLAAKAIELINESLGLVVAVDIPSGLDADSGEIPGPAVEADITLAMGALKPCHLLPPAARHCGEVEVIDVAYPQTAWDAVEPVAEVISETFCAAALPYRDPFGHKGTFGKVLVVGGSVGMAGAAALAAEAAYRAGAGLVHIACPEPLYAVLETSVTEVLVHPFPATKKGIFSKEAVRGILQLAKEMDVVICGPGLGKGEGPQAVVRALLEKVPRLLLDADGLNALVGRAELLRTSSGSVVVTPHPGEFVRLMGGSVDSVVAHKIEQARAAAREWDVVVVLKGPPTAVATPNGDVYLNIGGNTALAHGGSGDVLSGLIGGIWAGGAEALEAACVGVYVHAKVGEELAAEASQRGILPGDLLGLIPEVLQRLESTF
jgi:NAD(P)H-hydrate epimerase